MRLALLGATGRTGGYLLDQALSSGHEVRALVRNPAKLAIRQHPRLEVVKGDACNASDVARTLDGTEAVLFALGHTASSSSDVLATAARHVVEAARKQGVRRVVALTTGSMFHPEDRPTFVHRLLVALVSPLMRKRFDDAKREAATIQESGLDFVLVRATSLSNAPGTGNPRAGYLNGRVSATVSRSDVAHFMLQQVDDDTFLGQMPIVSRS